MNIPLFLIFESVENRFRFFFFSKIPQTTIYMGKASKCFKAILGFIKKNDSSSSSSPSTTTKEKWSDVKSYRDNYDDHHHNYDYGVSMLVHHKNDVVGVDLTEGVDVHSNSNGVVVTTSSSIRTTTVVTTTWNIEERAAVVIQSHFRAYLSRRALRALKGLVKLQALVRGHIVRKQTADMLRRMQVLIRAQSRALASRSHVFESPPFIAKSTQFHHHVGPTTPDKFEQIIRARSMKNDQMFMLKRNNTSKNMGNANAKQRNYLFHSSELSLNSDQFSFSHDNSPQLHSTASSICARSRIGPNGARSYTKNHPNYMCYTEAAKAKTRSMSAPKLRPDKRYSTSYMPKGSNSYVNFTSKGAYSGSVRGYSDEFNRDFLSHIY